MTFNQGVRDTAQSFTQEQVDRIVASRIMRERASFEGYETLRGVLDALRETGALRSSSVKGMAGELAELVRARQEIPAQPEESGEQVQPEDTQAGAVPDVRETQAAEIAAIPEPAGEEYLSPQDERVRKALAFSSYAAQSAPSGLPLEALYEGFERMYSIITGASGYPDAFKGAYINDAMSSETVRSARRELAGSAHGASRSHNDYMLTPRQTELARSAGMSLREYAALLQEAGKTPKSKG